MTEQEQFSEELQALEGISGDIAEHAERLKVLNKKGELALHVASELASTVFPLVLEFSQLFLRWAKSSEEFMSDIVDELEGGEGPGSVFSFEDLMILQDALMLALQHLGLTEQAEDLPDELKKVVSDQKKNFERMREVLTKEIETHGESTATQSEETAPEESAEETKNAVNS